MKLKEILNYKNTISLEERKIQEYIIKISTHEAEKKKLNDENETLKKEHIMCEELKYKNESKFSSKMDENANFKGLKDNYENILSQKSKSLKKYENEIFDLNISIENLKKIELLLKEELAKKHVELTKNNEVINCM